MKLGSFLDKLNEADRPIKWAIGDDSNHSQGGYGSKQDQENPEYTKVIASISDLFNFAHREFALDVNDPKGGRNAIGDRVGRAHSHWDQGGWMNPSVVGVNITYGRPEVSFGNGRHRLVAAYQRGQQFAPVLVPTDELEEFKKIVRTKPIVESAITEAGAGPSRLVTHIRSGTPFITMSAMRNEHSVLENNRADASLRKDISRLPVSMIPVYGGYIETTDGKPVTVREISYFIRPDKDVSLEKFYKIGLYLCRKFKQEAFGFGDGKTINIVTSTEGRYNDEPMDAMTFAAHNIPELPGFTMLKGRMGSFVVKMAKKKIHLI